MTLPQRTISLLMWSPSCCGVVFNGCQPSREKCALVSSDGEDVVERAVELRNDRRRRPGRRHDRDPGIGLITADAGLVHGRNVRHGVDPAGSGHRKRPQPAVADQLVRRAADVGEHHLHVAGDDVLHRRAAAAVADILDVEAGHGAEQLGVHMMLRADAAGRIVESRIGLQVADQVGDRMDRHRGMHDQHEGRGRDQRDRREVRHRIIGQLLVEADRDRKGR